MRDDGGQHRLEEDLIRRPVIGSKEEEVGRLVSILFCGFCFKIGDVTRLDWLLGLS